MDISELHEHLYTGAYELNYVKDFEQISKLDKKQIIDTIKEKITYSLYKLLKTKIERNITINKRENEFGHPIETLRVELFVFTRQELADYISAIKHDTTFDTLNFFTKMTQAFDSQAIEEVNKAQVSEETNEALVVGETNDTENYEEANGQADEQAIEEDVENENVEEELENEDENDEKENDEDAEVVPEDELEDLDELEEDEDEDEEEYN